MEGVQSFFASWGSSVAATRDTPHPRRARDDAATSGVTVANYDHRNGALFKGSHHRSELKRAAGLVDSLDGLKNQALEKSPSDPQHTAQLWRQYDVLALELRQLIDQLLADDN